MKYKGNGFLQGVPARDLTEQEARTYGVDRLLKSGLYELVEKEYKKKSKRYETADADGGNDS
jgi:hypothetical protein